MNPAFVDLDIDLDVDDSRFVPDENVKVYVNDNVNATGSTRVVRWGRGGVCET